MAFKKSILGFPVYNLLVLDRYSIADHKSTIAHPISRFGVTWNEWQNGRASVSVLTTETRKLTPNRTDSTIENGFENSSYLLNVVTQNDADGKKESVGDQGLNRQCLSRYDPCMR